MAGVVVPGYSRGPDVPVFSDYIRFIDKADDFHFSLAMLIVQGIDLPHLMIYSEKMRWIKGKDNSPNVKTAISESRPIAEPLAESMVFPGMVVQMISVGEATRALDAMFNKIADFYDEEVNTAVDGLTSIIKPLHDSLPWMHHRLNSHSHVSADIQNGKCYGRIIF